MSNDEHPKLTAFANWWKMDGVSSEEEGLKILNELISNPPEDIAPKTEKRFKQFLFTDGTKAGYIVETYFDGKPSYDAPEGHEEDLTWSYMPTWSKTIGLPDGKIPVSTPEERELALSIYNAR